MNPERSKETSRANAYAYNVQANLFPTKETKSAQKLPYQEPSGLAESSNYAKNFPNLRTTIPKPKVPFKRPKTSESSENSEVEIEIVPTTIQPIDINSLPKPVAKIINEHARQWATNRCQISKLRAHKAVVNTQSTQGIVPEALKTKQKLIEKMFLDDTERGEILKYLVDTHIEFLQSKINDLVAISTNRFTALSDALTVFEVINFKPTYEELSQLTQPLSNVIYATFLLKQQKDQLAKEQRQEKAEIAKEKNDIPHLFTTREFNAMQSKIKSLTLALDKKKKFDNSMSKNGRGSGNKKSTPGPAKSKKGNPKTKPKPKPSRKNKK